ncbi:HAD family hydrolase [Thermoactinospora rubra]|uniref:HAD family hydrolase n=1 Tax=Thermoactinospora rubra TaxID=1088767 RepID=UPI000A11D799|nr:HAD family phosphatase [Thermoactinospora rubra]
MSPEDRPGDRSGDRLDARSGAWFDAVLFDMDGTLVDTEGLWWSAVDAVAGALGRPLTPGDEPFVHGRTIEDTAAHLAPKGSAASLARRLTEEFTRRIDEGVRVLPGARSLLAQLATAGIPTALVSASPRSVVERILPLLEGHRFATVVADGDTPRGKPYPDPYLEAARRLGVAPSRCLAVEDSPAGVTAARAAGCRVVTVEPASGLPSLRDLMRLPSD